MKRLGLVFLLLPLMCITVMTTHATAQDKTHEILIMELESGNVVIEVSRDLAPRNAERIYSLATEGFYDNIVFHRVIPGFMAQTGDPTGTGRGSSSNPDVPLEASNVAFTRGTVGMARSQNPNSANSQFFICTADAPWLNGQYTAVGQVVSGMEFIDDLARGEPPLNPDRIITMRAQQAQQ